MLTAPFVLHGNLDGFALLLSIIYSVSLTLTVIIPKLRGEPIARFEPFINSPSAL